MLKKQVVPPTSCWRHQLRISTPNQCQKLVLNLCQFVPQKLEFVPNSFRGFWPLKTRGWRHQLRISTPNQCQKFVLNLCQFVPQKLEFVPNCIRGFWAHQCKGP